MLHYNVQHVSAQSSRGTFGVARSLRRPLKNPPLPGSFLRERLNKPASADHERGEQEVEERVLPRARGPSLFGSLRERCGDLLLLLPPHGIRVGQRGQTRDLRRNGRCCSDAQSAAVVWLSLGRRAPAASACARPPMLTRRSETGVVQPRQDRWYRRALCSRPPILRLHRARS